MSVEHDWPALCRRVSEALEPLPSPRPPNTWWSRVENVIGYRSPLVLWRVDLGVAKPCNFPTDTNAAVALMRAAAKHFEADMEVVYRPAIKKFWARFLGGLQTFEGDQFGEAILRAVAYRVRPEKKENL